MDSILVMVNMCTKFSYWHAMAKIKLLINNNNFDTLLLLFFFLIYIFSLRIVSYISIESWQYTCCGNSKGKLLVQNDHNLIAKCNNAIGRYFCRGTVVNHCWVWNLCHSSLFFVGRYSHSKLRSSHSIFQLYKWLVDRHTTFLHIIRTHDFIVAPNWGLTVFLFLFVMCLFLFFFLKM